MKPPWLAQSQESAELEALQTDVMRFVAILGLCLAAIFSLVHSAAVEQHAPEESRAVYVSARTVEPKASSAELKEPSAGLKEPSAELKEPSPKQKPSKVAMPQPEVAMDVSRPAPPPNRPKPPEHGFTLEFSSAGALDSLLRTGSVALYVQLDNAFLRLDPQGSFHPSDAPRDYYIMAQETVPERYLEAASLHGVREQAIWGVTLPAAITEQISRYTQSEQHGSLEIDGGGSVRLHGSAELATFPGKDLLPELQNTKRQMEKSHIE